MVAVLVVGGGLYAATSGDDDDGGTGGGGAPADVPADFGDLPIDEEPGGEAPLEEAGPPTPPPTGVSELDGFAQGCFEGSMDDCDSLYMRAITLQFENEAAIDYTIYSQSCGGRLASTASLDPCTQRVPNP